MLSKAGEREVLQRDVVTPDVEGLSSRDELFNGSLSPTARVGVFRPAESVGRG